MIKSLKFFNIFFLLIAFSGLVGCAMVCKKTRHIRKVTRNQNKVLIAIKNERSEDERLKELINKFTYAKEREQRLMLSLDKLVDSNEKVLNAIEGER